MKSKQGKHIYLYLALLCFIAILGIFIVDGYLGIYDTVYITAQEQEQKIESNYWEQNWTKTGGYSTGIAWEETIRFQYEIENRTFSAYSTTVESSLWKSGEKITNLFNKDISIDTFDKVTVDWVLTAQVFKDADLDIGEYTVIIKQGNVERKIVLNFYSEGLPYPKQPVPVR